MFKPVLSAVLGLALTAPAAIAEPTATYALAKSVPLGAPDRWDYVVFDAAKGRVFVAHGDRVALVDAKSGVLVGEVNGISGGTHGVATAMQLHKGYTDDGRAGEVIVFNLDTLKITKRIAVEKDADALVSDAMTGHIFVVEGDPGDVTVIDPKTDAVIATIKAGEKLEYAAGDGRGVIYVAGNEKRDVLRIDARTNTVTAVWPAPDCASPHGLAYDAAAKRLFMGCVNSKLMVMDAVSGKVGAELAIGRGSDAVAFDLKLKRVFSSNGLDGDVSVYQQVTPDTYEALPKVTTAVSGRTMSLDPATGRLFVAAAETDPPAMPGGRPQAKPGTLKLLILDPVK